MPTEAPTAADPGTPADPLITTSDGAAPAADPEIDASDGAAPAPGPETIAGPEVTVSGHAAPVAGRPRAQRRKRTRRRKRARRRFVDWYDRLDRAVTRWAMRSRPGKWLVAKLWMPLYAKTGLEALGEEDGAFYARLPFRRPNRNWYGDIAGSAMLAATELAAGEPLLVRYGEDHIVVCSHLSYDFLQPLRGAAILQATPQERLPEPPLARLFYVTFDLVVFEEDRKTRQRREAGRGLITFRLIRKSALPERPRPLLPL